MNRFTGTIFIIALLFLGIIGSLSPLFVGRSFAKETGKYYMAHNIWYEKPNLVDAINYKKGVAIPAGSEVDNIMYGSGFIQFRVVATDVVITMKINPKYQNNDLSESDLAARTLTKKTFNQLTEGLSSSEIDAIRAGRVEKGMSKKAVLISFGYPPKHQTPSLDDNVWRYWRDRFRTIVVEFDASGQVSDIKGK